MTKRRVKRVTSPQRNNSTDGAPPAVANSVERLDGTPWTGGDDTHTGEGFGAYERTASISEVLEDIGTIAAIDAARGQDVKKWSLIAVCGGLLLAIGVMWFVFLSAEPTPAGPSLLLPGLVGVPGLIVLWYAIRRALDAKRRDLVDRRYALLRELMLMLKRDSQSPASVQLELRPPNDPRKKVRSGKVGHWSVDYYADRWLDVGGRFADGTKYTITMVEKFQYRHRTKQSASGKLKQKSKTKGSTTTTVRLRFKPTKYPRVREFAAQGKKAIKLPKWVSSDSYRVSDDELVLRSSTDLAWKVPELGTKRPFCDGVVWISQVLLSMYQLLNLARAIDKNEAQ